MIKQKSAPVVTVPTVKPRPSAVDFASADEEAPGVILGGVYPRENNPWRWGADRIILELDRPKEARRVTLDFAVPDMKLFAKGTQSIMVNLDNASPVDRCCFGPGGHQITVDLPPAEPKASSLRVEFLPKITFVPAEVGLGTDARVLGIILKRVAVE